MIEQLRQLVFDGGFDDESKQHVAELEERLRREVMKEHLAANTVVAEYVQYLKDEVSRCKELLSENGELTDKQHATLFARKDQCRRFLDIFEPQREAIEKEINDLLNVAKAQK